MTQAAPSLPLDPQVERIVRDSFARQGLMRHLGAELHEVARGRVSIRLPFRETLTQQHGYCKVVMLLTPSGPCGSWFPPNDDIAAAMMRAVRPVSDW